MYRFIPIALLVHDSHALQNVISKPLRRHECVLFVIQHVQCTLYTQRSFTSIAWLRTWLVRRALRIYKNSLREKKLSPSTLWADAFRIFIFVRSRISLHKRTRNDYISVSTTFWNTLNAQWNCLRIHCTNIPIVGLLWDHYVHI